MFSWVVKVSDVQWAAPKARGFVLIFEGSSKMLIARQNDSSILGLHSTWNRGPQDDSREDR